MRVRESDDWFRSGLPLQNALNLLDVVKRIRQTQAEMRHVEAISLSRVEPGS